MERSGGLSVTPQSKDLVGEPIRLIQFASKPHALQLAGSDRSSGVRLDDDLAGTRRQECGEHGLHGSHQVVDSLPVSDLPLEAFDAQSTTKTRGIRGRHHLNGLISTHDHGRARQHDLECARPFSLP